MKKSAIQWIKNGAQLTQTVYNLFKTQKLNEKINSVLKSEKVAAKQEQK
nr:hypothetical protein [Mycoplasmopsis bovis]